MRPAEKRQRLAVRKLVGIWSIIRSGNKYTLSRAFVHYGSIQIPNRCNTNRVGISFRLNHDLSTADRVWVKRNRVNTAISTRLGYTHLAAGRREFLFEDLSN